MDRRTSSHKHHFIPDKKGLCSRCGAPQEMHDPVFSPNTTTARSVKANVRIPVKLHDDALEAAGHGNLSRLICSALVMYLTYLRGKKNERKANSNPEKYAGIHVRQAESSPDSIFVLGSPGPLPVADGSDHRVVDPES